MIKGDYDKLKKLSQYNVCSEHHTPLIVAWHSVEKAWVLRCGHGHYPDSITRQPSLTSLYKQGEELPSYIEDNIKRKQGGKAMTNETQRKGTRYWLVPTADLGTGQLLTPEYIKALVEYARKYDLDPERGHVVMMYGQPYFTIDAYLYHANRTGQSFSMDSRPLSDDELKQYRAPENAMVWVCIIRFSDTGETFRGYGVVTEAEITAKSDKHPEQLRSPVVAAHPQLLAQKRAEWQTLRRAFPIGGE